MRISSECFEPHFVGCSLVEKKRLLRSSFVFGNAFWSRTRGVLGCSLFEQSEFCGFWKCFEAFSS